MDRRRFLTLAGLTAAGAAALAEPAAADPPPWSHSHHATTTSSSTSTSAVATTTTEPTTTTTEPMPTTTSVTIGTGNQLAWSPPALTSPVTYHVGQGSALGTTPGTITAPAGQDSIVIFDGVINQRLRLSGGRHWQIIGFEIDIDRDWSAAPNGSLHPDFNNGLWVDGATGTVHLEGGLVHGAFINDGLIKGASPAAIFQVQNCRIVGLVGTNAGYHADVTQPYGGFQELRVDKVTGESQFQGQMFKADFGRWLTIDIRRYNLRHLQGATREGKLVNFVPGGPNPDGFPWVEGPVHLGQDFYIYSRGFTDPIDNTQPPGDMTAEVIPNGWFVFSGSNAGGTGIATPNPAGWAATNPGLVIDGIIRNNTPPGGDWCPAGVAGLGYVSPGYLT